MLKLFAIVAVIVVLLVSVACSKSNNESTATKESPVNASKEPGPSNESSTKVNATGSPVSFTVETYNANWNYARELKKDDVYTTRLKELTGVDVDFQFFDGADQFTELATRLASRDLPDVYEINQTIQIPELAGAIEGGAILPLNELLEKYGQDILAAFPEEVWKSPNISKDGVIYGIPKLNFSTQPYGFIVRKDFLDKLGMDVPVTMDDYLAFFKAIKETDLNGNGQHDEIPLLMSKSMGVLNWAFEGYFDVFPGQWEWENGQAAPDIISPKIKDLLAFYKDLYDKGYINQDMFTISNDDRANIVYNGSVGMFVHSVHHAAKYGAYGNPEKYKDKDADVFALNGPVRPDGTLVFQPAQLPFSNIYIIDAKTEHPEEIVKYFNWYLEDIPEEKEFFTYGVEGHNFTRDGGKVVYDPLSQVNLDENGIHRSLFSLMKGDLRVSDDVLALDPIGASIIEAKKKGIEAGDDRGIFKYLPQVKSLLENPQLGSGAGSLYADMYAKVIMGREPLDKAFDDFVQKWKAQGGDKAIAEVTEWYNANK